MIRINARALIIKDNNILLVKNIKKGFYFLPGGGLEFGETLQDAIKREFQEEADFKNLEVKSIVGIFENIFIDEIKYHTIENLVEVDVFDTNIVSVEDHISFEWVPVENITQIKYYPTLLGTKILEWHKDHKFISGVRKEF